MLLCVVGLAKTRMLFWDHQLSPPASNCRQHPRRRLSARPAAMNQRKLKLPIPVTILTGSLGVGKTTALCQLVAQKPADEVWCCIVNEFGAVGIDAVAIESSSSAGNVTVKQLAGGCMCCVLSGPLSAAIAQIIRQAKPDRVIIEPSGLGHPGGLIDILQGPHLRTSLQLNAVICLVDLSNFEPGALMANSTAADQVTVADVLVGSKADAATPEFIAAFQQWTCEELFPPKSDVLVISHGQLDAQWLDTPRLTAAGQIIINLNRRSSRALRQQHSRKAGSQLSYPQQQQIPALSAAVGIALPSDATVVVDSTAAGAAPGAGSRTAEATSKDDSGKISSSSSIPQPGQPQRVLGVKNGQSGQYRSCGWVFDQQDMFDQAKVLQLLHALQPYVARVKGVFRVGAKQWVMPVTDVVVQEVERQEGQKQQDQQQEQQLRDPVLGQQQGEQQLPSCGLQMQPVCYRGPSMIEVIVDCDSSGMQQLHGALVALPATKQQDNNSNECGGSAGVNGVAYTAVGLSEMSVGPNVGYEEGIWQKLDSALVACL